MPECSEEKLYMKKRDPLVQVASRWRSAEVIATLATQPNARLMQFAAGELGRSAERCLLDIGCGAGCNAVPLASQGWNVLGIDLSEPMLEATKRRAEEHALTDRLQLRHASMEELPVEDQSCDLIVAHGIWNLAPSAAEFRKAVREAARAARPGAALFVFTFSRNTLSADDKPVADKSFVFTQFSGEPQCFLTEMQLIQEMASAGFTQELGEPVKEHNLRSLHSLQIQNAPVIYEGIFRRQS
jgi:ubiquinone/menaquinone biosynthesis C-methylase UbiE